jgi:hypothetical protein
MRSRGILSLLSPVINGDSKKLTAIPGNENKLTGIVKLIT